MRAYSIVSTLLMALALPATAQEEQQQRRQHERPAPCTEFRIGVGGADTRCVVGLRASARDRGHRQVNGVDLSLVNVYGFALDGGDSSSVVNGATLSLVGADGWELNGVNAGLVFAHGTRSLSGISLGVLAAGSEGTIRGITGSGIFIYGEEVWGLNATGVALVARERLRGVNLAGFAVTGKRVVGLNGSGWFVHAGSGGLTGVSAGLVGAGAEGPVRGITAGGVGVFGRSEVSGVAAAFGVVDARDLNGIAASAHNRVRGTQRGLAVGLLNRAGRLRGVQVGLLNEARNNPRLLRWVPLVNVNL